VLYWFYLRTSDAFINKIIVIVIVTYSQGNMEKCWETRGGVGKSGVQEHKSGNISETR